MSSIAACINVYNDAQALRGCLEMAQRYFDNIFVIHSGPGGAASRDGTMEVLASFGISPVMADMNDGFGAIRSRLIHECGCEWAFILDADERFFPAIQVMDCSGSEMWQPPNGPRPNLTVTHKADLISQGAHLRHLIGLPHIDAVKTIRRHWFDFSMKHPGENWIQRKDWQLRIVRNRPEIGYRTNVRMHEQIVDARTGGMPRHFTADDYGGPFHDHFHLFFRQANPGHKEGNEKYYSTL